MARTRVEPDNSLTGQEHRTVQRWNAGQLALPWEFPELPFCPRDVTQVLSVASAASYRVTGDQMPRDSCSTCFARTRDSDLNRPVKRRNSSSNLLAATLDSPMGSVPRRTSS